MTKTHVTPPQKLDRQSSQSPAANKAHGIRDPICKPIATIGPIRKTTTVSDILTTLPDITIYVTRKKNAPIQTARLTTTTTKQVSKQTQRLRQPQRTAIIARVRVDEPEWATP